MISPSLIIDLTDPDFQISSIDQQDAIHAKQDERSRIFKVRGSSHRESMGERGFVLLDEYDESECTETDEDYLCIDEEFFGKRLFYSIDWKSIKSNSNLFRKWIHCSFNSFIFFIYFILLAIRNFHCQRNAEFQSKTNRIGYSHR